MSSEPSEEDGWIEIGKRCSVGRRSLWARWIYNAPPSAAEEAMGFRVASVDQVEAIELRAGREGGDAFVRIDRSNPQFEEIENILGVARFAATS